MADILAVVGSVRFAYPRGLAIARGIIDIELDARTPDAVTSGGAAGVDSLAEMIAEGRHIRTVIHRPAVPQWRGAGGFMERNRLIANVCTRALRIVCGNSRTYGSGWTCDRVREQGKPVRLVTIHADGTVVDSRWPVRAIQPINGEYL